MNNVENTLEIYRQRLVNANRNVNLVSRRDVHKVSLRLIRESLLPLEWEVCKLRPPVLDVGSGAGIPGIPLAIANPNIQITLLDANRKKTLFLRKVAAEMRLNGVTIVWDRVETYAADRGAGGKFSTIVSRGVPNVGRMIECSERLLEAGGELILWKGTSSARELESIDRRVWNEPEFRQEAGGPILVRMVKMC